MQPHIWPSASAISLWDSGLPEFALSKEVFVTTLILPSLHFQDDYLGLWSSVSCFWPFPSLSLTLQPLPLTKGVQIPLSSSFQFTSFKLSPTPFPFLFSIVLAPQLLKQNFLHHDIKLSAKVLLPDKKKLILHFQSQCFLLAQPRE